MKFKKMIVCLLLIAALSSVVFAGSASAKQTVFEDPFFEDTLKQGEGYQINNYAIIVSQVFPEADNVIFRVYELPADDEDDPIEDEMLGINSSFEFNFEGEDVEVTLLDVQGTGDSIYPRAEFAITITDDDVINFEKEIDSLGDAKDIGEPNVEITKSLSKEVIEIGDSVRVTVKAKNTGNGVASNIRFTNDPPTKFIVEEYILSQSGEISLEEGEEDTIYVYTIKATEAGQFTLNPTTAKYSNEVGVDFPQTSSNTPTITVEGEPAAMADVEVSAELQETVIPRGESTEVTLLIRNNGEGDAEAVSVDIQLPEGLEYESGDSEIEIISGTPTIYLETLGVQQEKEFTFNVKAEEMGSYPVTASYSYISAEDPEAEEINSETTTNALEVTKGKYDVIFEQPLYVYIVPVVIVLGAAAWIYYRRQQYRF
ncbi:BatD family protein [Methanohalophilus sp.]